MSPERAGGRSALAWLALSAVVIVLDQWTKLIAVGALDLYQSIPVFPGLNWTLLHNYGAAFSFLSDHSGWQRWFFIIVAFVITVALIIWLARLPRGDWRNALPIALVVGGAVGNVIDRIAYGYVIDFIDVYYASWHWPAFNVADSAISVGAVALIIFGFKTESPDGEDADDKA
ncbi:MAG: signal peptidase II [Pseudomonadota bacterium]